MVASGQEEQSINVILMYPFLHHETTLEFIYLLYIMKVVLYLLRLGAYLHIKINAISNNRSNMIGMLLMNF